jgi:hypothetical protein
MMPLCKELEHDASDEPDATRRFRDCLDVLGDRSGGNSVITP